MTQDRSCQPCGLRAGSVWWPAVLSHHGGYSWLLLHQKKNCCGQLEVAQHQWLSRGAMMGHETGGEQRVQGQETWSESQVTAPGHSARSQLLPRAVCLSLEKSCLYARRSEGQNKCLWSRGKLFNREGKGREWNVKTTQAFPSLQGLLVTGLSVRGKN